MYSERLIKICNLRKSNTRLIPYTMVCWGRACLENNVLEFNWVGESNYYPIKCFGWNALDFDSETEYFR